MAIRRLQGNGTAGNKASDSSPQAHLRGPALAYAGKILRRWGSSYTFEAHPRTCGENLTLLVVSEGFQAAHPRICGEDSTVR